MSSPSTPANALLGKNIDGYQIEKLLDQNTMSTVYLAHSQKQDRAVLFTMFAMPERFSLQARQGFHDRFLRLVPALARLRHPHILPVSDFGVQPGFPYLVTALMPGSTLAAFLQHQSQSGIAQVLDIVRQIAEGLEYAHRLGVVHGSLSSSNIMLDETQHVQIAHFGLVQLLSLSGIEHLEHPYAHLLSVAMTFLGDPLIIAPEVVQGMPVTCGADIYALGILLFELLSGKPPFTGADPLKTALARLQMPVPSISALRPDLPSSLDVVMQRALERDPLQRYPSIGSLVEALKQAMREGNTAKQATMTAQQDIRLFSQERSLSERTWVGDEASVVNTRVDMHQQETQAADEQSVSSFPTAPHLSVPQQAMSAESLNSPEEGAIDPFYWWSPAALPPDDRRAFSSVVSNVPSQPSMIAMRAPSHPPLDKNRRRIVALLAAGGVAVAAGLGIGGISLAQRLQHTKSPSLASGNMGAAAHPTTASQPGLTPTQKPRSTPSPTVRPSPTPSPTTQPSPTPTPGHTGTVVGSTNQGANTSKTFSNPADGNKSLLIHLSNGNFVAFESACTHEGVTCYYDTGQQKIVCPRHNALFDPADNAAVLQGPPDKPLSSVPVKVNGDGTITVG
jgi:serine/threonine protein kinase